MGGALARRLLVSRALGATEARKLMVDRSIRRRCVHDLVRVTRVADAEYPREDLGPVVFVPCAASARRVTCGKGAS